MNNTHLINIQMPWSTSTQEVLALDSKGTVIDQPRADSDTIDGKGLTLLPGMIDLSEWLGHSDYRPQGYPDEELAAAVRCGFSRVCVAPDSAHLSMQTQDRDHSEQAMPHLIQVGEMTADLASQTLADYNLMAQNGLSHLGNGACNPDDQRLMLSAFKVAQANGMTMHCMAQDNDLSADGCAHDGRLAARLGLRPIPVVAETLELARIIALVEQTGCSVHLRELTSAAGLRLVEQAKRSGLPITADTTMVHLFLSEQNLSGFNASCHVLPPLRSTEDRDALIDGLKSGLIDAISSGHQPLNRDAKLAPFPSTEPGMSTIDVFLALGLRLVHDEHIELARLVELTVTQPAHILKLDQVGLSDGCQGDFMLIDPYQEWQYSGEAGHSGSPHSGFEGWRFTGRIKATWINGQPVYQADSD